MAKENFMNSRLKHIYLLLGRVLNNPRAFGLEERPPKALEDALTKVQSELMKELQEEISEEEFLSTELSQDADRPVLTGVTSTSFSVQGTGM
jgi:hypothetical protein